MKILPYNISLFFILLTTTEVLSQSSTISKIMRTSPEMASLVQRVDIPVNYSSGVINFSINLYTLQLKDIAIPINLNYISKGFKPSEISSNVGLGWDLDVGGKISHEINGIDDLISQFPNFPVDRPLKMHFFEYSSLPQLFTNEDFNMLYNITSRNTFSGGYNSNEIFYSNWEAKKDSEPDIFYYSLLGKTGKFFLDNERSGRQIPFGKEKINYVSNENKFTIVDTSGNIYEYAAIGSLRQRSGVEIIQGNYPSTLLTTDKREFYLSKVSTSSEFVDFIYQNVEYSYNNPSSYLQASTDDYFNPLPHGQTPNYEIKHTSIVEKHTVPLLKEIKVNGQVRARFSYNESPRVDIKNIFKNKISAIDKISIVDGLITKTISFNHSYFFPHHRLKLDGFTIDDQDYTFLYYEGDFPSYDTESLDFWGFYSSISGSRYADSDFYEMFYSSGKGKPSLTSTQLTLLKKVVYPAKGSDEFIYELNTYDEGNYKNYLEHNQVYGVYYSEEDLGINNEFYAEDIFTLDKSTQVNFQCFIPDFRDTGGQTAYNWVQFGLQRTADNSYVPLPVCNGNQKINLGPGEYKLWLKAKGAEGSYFMVSWKYRELLESGRKNLDVGGIRVKAQITKDNNNEVVFQKNLKYTNEGISTGKLYDYPVLRQLEETQYISAQNDCLACEGSFTYKKKYSSSINNILGFNGSPVFYSSVTELMTDKYGNDNGKAVYEFYDESDSPLFYDSPFVILNDNSWKRGYLKSKTLYRKGESNFFKQLINHFTFETVTQDNPEESNLDFTPPSFPNEYHAMSYKFKVVRPILGYADHQTYFFKPPIFDYIGKKIISAQVYLNKEINNEYFSGNILTSTTDYNYDNPLHGQLTSQTTVFADRAVLEKSYKYAHEKGNQKLIDANMVGIPLETEVKKDGTVISKTETKYEDPTHLFPTSVKAYNTEKKVLSEELIYDHYDSNGNLLQYTTKAGVPTAIVWGYNNTQPIAKIEGATYDQVSALALDIIAACDADALQAPGNDETTLLELLDTFRKNLPAHQVTTYTYDPLIGVRSVTPPSGLREVYEYDSAGRLESVKDREGRDLKKYQYHYKTP